MCSRQTDPINSMRIDFNEQCTLRESSENPSNYPERFRLVRRFSAWILAKWYTIMYLIAESNLISLGIS